MSGTQAQLFEKRRILKERWGGAMKKTELGAWGENLAADYLRKTGYRIVSRNFRCRLGEIDLIAQRGNILAFVEVKLRKTRQFGEAREFVTFEKQRKTRLAASYYLSGSGINQSVQPRFDVMEVYAPNGVNGPFTVNYLENAFE